MAEYTNSVTQTVAPNAAVLFNERAAGGCYCGISHREGSGIFSLAGGQSYLVGFGANIAVPAGGTAGPISVAIALDGEALPPSTAIVTPAAAGDFWNVYVTAVIRTPCRCCQSVSVRNTTASGPIDVANANLTISKL